MPTSATPTPDSSRRWVWIAPNGQVQILSNNINVGRFNSTTICIPGKLIVDVVDGEQWVYINESLMEDLPE